MIPVAERVEQYLVQRQAFGIGLSVSSVRELRRFAAFAADEGAEQVTTELFLRWRLCQLNAVKRRSRPTTNHPEILQLQTGGSDTTSRR